MAFRDGETTDFRQDVDRCYYDRCGYELDAHSLIFVYSLVGIGSGY